MLLLALAGCPEYVVSTECLVERLPIDDDEVAGDLGVTPREILDRVEGPFAFAGAYADDSPVDGGGSVSRGAGQAYVTDTTPVATRQLQHLGLPGGTVELTTEVVCEDGVEIPVEVLLVTGDGAVDVALDATAGLAGADRYEVRGDVDPGDIEAFPPAPGPGRWPTVELQWTEEGFDSVSVGWDGDEYTQIFEGGPA